MTLALVRRLAAAALFSGLVAVGVAFVAPGVAGADDGPKNLKVFPAGTTKADLKKSMKKISAALGVECDFCHDTDDFAKDGEHKEAARAMMKMTMELNKTYFKGEMRVGCVTCHNGAKEPKKL